MAASIRMQQVASMLQKMLGEILIRESPMLWSNEMITVTEVAVSPDLGIAKVYLSFLLSKDKTQSLANVESHTKALRRLLGMRVKNKLRRVPELRFYLDDSATHAARINQLLDAIDIPEDIE